jgi:serine/threonine-protein kinase
MTLMTDSTTSQSPHARRSPWTRGLSATLALTLIGASLGSTTAAIAQQKPAPAKSAAPSATPKAPASAAAKPAAKASATAKVEKKKTPPKDPKKEAGIHFKKGEDLFKKKQFKESKAEYEEAEELFPGATPKYWIARNAEELGEYAEAAAWYDKAIELAKLKPEMQKEAQDRVAALKAKPAKVKVTSDPPGAVIIVDGKAIPEKTPADVELAPGKHKIALSADKKKPFEREVEVVPFKGGELVATLEAVPEKTEDPFNKAPPPPVATAGPVTPGTALPPGQEDVSPRRDHTWVYVTGAAAIVGIGVGTFFGVKALSDKKDYDATPTQDIHDRGTRNALISDMGFGIGVTLAITSAVLFFTAPSGEPAKKSAGLKVTPIAAPGAGGIGFAGAQASFHF